MVALLDLVELCKDYKDGKVVVHALKNVNLQVEKGEFTAIAGPSGSGKSTLLNLIGCLDKPTAGKVLISGIDTSKYTRRELADIRRERIGFVFQSFNLIPILTAYENAAFPLSLLGKSSGDIDRIVKTMLRDVGLNELEPLSKRPIRRAAAARCNRQSFD